MLFLRADATRLDEAVELPSPSLNPHPHPHSNPNPNPNPNRNPNPNQAVELPEPARADVEQLVAWVERMRAGSPPEEGGVPPLPARESTQPGKKDEL